MKDQIHCGRCEDLIPQLPDRSVNLVVTSPPYAQQRRKQYGGVDEQVYPAWFASLMTALKPKMKPDGSVFVVIRAHIKKGQISDYVMRTRLAVRESGWIECEQLVWHKPDAGPFGHVYRPRRNFEEVLWFSPSRRPYTNLKACGNPTNRVGFATTKSGLNPELYHGSTPYSQGTAKIPDVIQAYVGSIPQGIPHSAVFPPALPSTLIRSFSKVGDLVLDIFSGSGTTCLAAKELGRHFLGFEVKQDCAKLSRSRLNDSTSPTKLAKRSRNDAKPVPMNIQELMIKRRNVREKSANGWFAQAA